MFYDLMKRLEADGVKVEQIRGTWLDGDDSVNFNQFRNLTTKHPFMTQKEAAFNTWTGQRAMEF